MPAPSLLQLAMATAIRNVKFLDDLGGLPYFLARPLLQKIDNPEKLHSLEIRSPHLAKKNKEIWLEFIKRDIPKWERYEIPEESDKWYEVYCDLREAVQREIDADAEKMMMALNGIKSERDRLTPKIVSAPQGKGGQRRPTSSFRFSGSRPDFSSSVGKRKQNIFTPQRRNNALAMPTKKLNSRASQVKQAPRSLIEIHRRPEPSEEARLRAIASGKQPPPLSTEKIPIPTGASSAKQENNLKRRATSPPPPVNSAAAQASTGSASAARPAMPSQATG
ncbi:RNA polymerase II transcription factor SIII (Elongin) subunit A [Penicillium malachiteum]|uniref:RNA polymerase II transcription factor SIII (Elongin) subunit A n=1 Tax=Penicillium malachiteum TaxID=1324776 RepID=A0AAD6HRI5_9EURO|nr:RNA polymerase II transcription factor SIII (Elongin) subunit A [Penicillium malachiteum]